MRTKCYRRLRRNRSGLQFTQITALLRAFNRGDDYPVGDFHSPVQMKKKKLIISLIVGTAALILVGTLIVALTLEWVIKSGVESVGPRMTQTAVTLESMEISPFSGTGSINGLHLGNPEGYTTEFAIKLDRALLHIDPTSLWSDKVIVETFQMDAPEITFEGNRSENNLGKILENVADYVGELSEHQFTGKLQVNHFRLSGGKVHLRLSMFGKQTITLSAPEIELRDLGTGPDGITSTELTQLIIKKISSKLGMLTTAAAGQSDPLSAGSSTN